MIRESESIGETSFESCSSTAYGAASQASSRGASKRWSTNPLERSSREGGTGNKPHKANDRRWEAIKLLRERDGKVGLSHFRLLQRLGSGDIGSVYLAELRGAGCCFAMKVMDKTALASRNKLPRADTEREILASLDHPFLPTLYAHFETAQFSCLVMEFCPGGDLHSLRQRQSGKCFDEDAARFYAAEVLLALEYLHMMGVVYRDLKPENVLVREDGHIMLSDFDLSLICDVSPTVVHSTSSVHRSSRQISFKSDNSCILPSCVAPCTTIRPVVACVPIALQKNSALKNKKYGHRDGDSASKVAPLPELIAEPTDARSMSFVGTHEYLAPEIISGGGHGSAVDWWTFGIFLYELLYGRTPFRGENNESTLMNVLRKNLEFPESIEVRECAKNLIKGLLIKDPERRLASARGAAEVKQHPFFDGINWALIRCAYPPDVPGPYRLVPESGFLANSNSAGSSKETSAVSTPTSTAKLKKNRSVGGSFSSDSLPNLEYF